MNREKRKPVSFVTTKRIPRRVNISFNPNRTKKVSFIATKRNPKKIKVDFYE